MAHIFQLYTGDETCWMHFFLVGAVIRYALITDLNYDKLLTISFKRYEDLVKHKTSLFLLHRSENVISMCNRLANRHKMTTVWFWFVPFSSSTTNNSVNKLTILTLFVCILWFSISNVIEFGCFVGCFFL